MFKRTKHWKLEAQKAKEKEFDAMFECEVAVSLLRKFIKSLEVDGFGHVKGINTGIATDVYHEYLDDFITKN